MTTGVDGQMVMEGIDEGGVDGSIVVEEVGGEEVFVAIGFPGVLREGGGAGGSRAAAVAVAILRGIRDGVKDIGKGAADAVTDRSKSRCGVEEEVFISYKDSGLRGPPVLKVPLGPEVKDAVVDFGVVVLLIPDADTIVGDEG